MKKILTICASALIFAACSNDKELDTKTDVVLTDTTGMYKSNYSTDVSTPVADEAATKAAPTKVIRETRVVYVDRTPKAKTPVYHEATPVEPVVTQPQPNTSNTGTSTSDNSGGVNGTAGTGTETAPTTEPVKKEKEGWSNAAKDAVIGGVAGGVLGAVIAKKKVKGAVIGGILGAAGGYILGKKKDKSQQETADAKYTSF